MTSCDVMFPGSMPDDTVKKHIDVITNAMWYLDGNKQKLTDRAKQSENVAIVPDRFVDNFNDYNDWKKKEQRAPRLQASELKKHSGGIFRLVSMVFTQRWGTFGSDLEQLAVAMDSYAEFLEMSNEQQAKRQKLDHPSRQLGNHSEIQHRIETDTVHKKYTNLDNDLSRQYYTFVSRSTIMQ
ncbi:hypothetical protein MAR_036196, partial [Mya arenaria]